MRPPHVAFRDEVVIEVVTLHLLCAGVLLADAEPDGTAEEGRAVRGPREVAHLVGLCWRPADVLTRDRHAADVDKEVGVRDVCARLAVCAKLVDRVIRNRRLRDACIDERAGRVPWVRREVRRHPEVRRFVDVAVDDRNGGVGRGNHADAVYTVEAENACGMVECRRSTEAVR